MISVWCPTCRAAGDMPDGVAGRAVVCGKCRSYVQVPAMALRADPLAGEPPRRVGRQVATAVRLLGWAGCLVWTGWVFLSTAATLARAQSAVQEASASACGAFFVIVGYVVARCVHEFTR